MSSEWVTVEQLLTRGEIELIQDGNHGGNYPSVEEFTSTGVPLITGACLLDGSIDYSKAGFISAERASKLRVGFAKAGDVLLTHKGTMGKTALVPISKYPVTILNPQITLYRVASGGNLNRRFLKFFFDSQIFQNYLVQVSATSTINTLPIKEQKKLEIPLLSMTLQERIVGILGALDDRITLLRETNATLEAIAQALFKSWFVDFDPVRAKAEGRQPEGMHATTAALFPDSFEESELGLVPKGWAVRSIYEIARVIYGAPFASKRFNSEAIGIPLVRIRDLKDESPGVYTDEVHPKGYMIQPGDIVVGMDGEFRAYLWGGKPAWLNQRVCVFAPVSGVPAAFVHKSISPLLAAVEASETATTVIHLGKNDIDRFRIVVPDAMVLAAFSEIVTPIYARIVEGKQTASTLTSSRDTLLPRLISGQLRLPEAEALIEEEV